MQRVLHDRRQLRVEILPERVARNAESQPTESRRLCERCRVWLIGTMRSIEYRPFVGRRPAMPQSAAGMRTDPPVSVPRPAGQIRAAIPAPVPPLLPPGIIVGSYGLCTAPKW